MQSVFYLLLCIYKVDTATTEEDINMKQITLKATSENEMKFFENGLKQLGYEKTNDCMWAKIYTKDNSEYVVKREY